MDFVATPHIVIFNDTSTDNQVNFPLIDDDVLEGDEDFKVLLQILTTTKNVLPGCDVAITTIVEDDSKASLWHRLI